jgi:hypothetical protein
MMEPTLRCLRALPRSAAGAAVFLACACSGDVVRSGVLVTDSAGVRIVASGPPAWAEGEAWRVVAEPEVMIGAADGHEAYLFSGIVGGARLPEGELVIADGFSATIRVFDGAGRHLRTIGGAGGGPGEFERLTGIRLRGDTILAYDGYYTRVTYFGANGSLLGTEAVPDAAGQELHLLDDGSLVTLARPRPGDAQPAIEGYYREAHRVVVFDRAQNRTVQIGPFAGTERHSEPRRVGDVTYVANRPIPFGRSLQLAAADRRIVVGTGDAAELHVYAPDGTLREIYRYDVEPLPVSDAHRAALADRLARNAQEADATREQVLARIRSQGSNVVPPYARISLDAAGYTWLAEYPAHTPEPRRWTVLDPTGALLGTVELPLPARILDIGDDYILAAYRDALDIEYVALFRLERWAGSASRREEVELTASASLHATSRLDPGSGNRGSRDIRGLALNECDRCGR